MTLYSIGGQNHQPPHEPVRIICLGFSPTWNEKLPAHGIVNEFGAICPSLSVASLIALNASLFEAIQDLNFSYLISVYPPALAKAG